MTIHRFRQAGFTMPEILAVLAVMALVGGIAITYVVPWLGREAGRGAVYQVQQAMQIARAQAIARNRDTRLVVDAATRQIAVIDLNDPSNLTDDLLVHNLTLPKNVRFWRPDTGSAVTLTFVSTNLYQATFTSDGSVTGAGIVALTGGSGSYRITLYGAGGTAIERWAGSSWVTAT
jgi:prepilin-type N-terminal cleavage/methylation domain-containing protein